MKKSLALCAITWTIILSAGETLADERNEHRPVYSPDGAAIIFMSMSEATGGDWELFLMDGQGKNAGRVTYYTGWDGYAVWSPAGDIILFDRSLTGDLEHSTPFGRNIMTGREWRLGEYEGWLPVGDWSADGTLLAFWERDGQRDLYLLNADGSFIRQLTDTRDMLESDASFSPDGGRIVFASQPVVVSGDRPYALELIDIEGNGRRVIHRSNGRIYGVTWSPDGRSVAYTDAPGGEEDDADIFIMNLGNGEIAQVTHNPAWDHMPDWRPDGRQLLFTSYRSGEERIYAVDLPSGAVTLLCPADGMCATGAE